MLRHVWSVTRRGTTTSRIFSGTSTGCEFRKEYNFDWPYSFSAAVKTWRPHTSSAIFSGLTKLSLCDDYGPALNSGWSYLECDSEPWVTALSKWRLLVRGGCPAHPKALTFFAATFATKGIIQSSRDACDKSALLAHGWALQARLHRSRCRLGVISYGHKKPFVTLGVKVTLRQARLVLAWVTLSLSGYVPLRYVIIQPGWLCGTVVERRSVTGEHSLSYAWPIADGWPLI